MKQPRIAPAMTALIDKGVTNLDTGLYMFLGDALGWSKIGVPEEGERYHILKGDAGFKHHTIRNSFIFDTRPPSETQVFSANTHYQELKEATLTVVVSEHVASNVVLDLTSLREPVFGTTLQHGRALTLHNASPTYTLTLLFADKQSFVVLPNRTEQVYLTVKQHDNKNTYRLAASSYSN